MIELLRSEAGIRLAFFSGVLTLMAVWESLAPRRVLQVNRRVSWANNLGLVFLNTLALRLIAPVGAVGFAIFVESKNWGLLNLWPLPNWLSVVVCLILLDLVVYGQHVLFHSIPALWRLHMVHHADREFDVTTGLRFHTFEVILSLGFKCVAIIVLGAPSLAVLIFEVLLNAMSMFNHSNVTLPLRLDRILRLFLVTPDMHRVHHSIIRRETNSNFGFSFSAWDWIFRTYRDQPEKGHTEMTIGLPEFNDRRVESLTWMLIMPFLKWPNDTHDSSK